MSLAEETLAAQLDQARIPFEREFRFAPPRRWRADFRVEPNHPRTAILVEVDGGGFIGGGHSRGAGIYRDSEKQSAAAILGYRVIRCTPRQVEDGTALSWIEMALGRRAVDLSGAPRSR